MPTKMLLAKTHAVGTTRPPKSGTLKITVQKTAAPDSAALPVWKLFWNLPVSSLVVQIVRTHISA
jgi:hypothetical protein